MHLLLFHTISLLFWGISIYSAQHVTDYEIENLFVDTDPGKIASRSGASGGLAVYSRQGDKYEINICPTDPIDIIVDGVFYSNDGWSDKVDIHVGEKYVGSFRTEANKDGYGRFWNEFKSSGQVGTLVSLSPGRHPILLTVNETDWYGVELDKIVLQTGLIVDENAFWCQTTADSTTKILEETTTLSFTTSAITEAQTMSTEPTSTSSETTTPETTVSTSITKAQTDASQTTSTTSATTTGEITKPFIQQLSFKTKCLDEQNVRVRFNPTTLKGVEIISSAAPINQGSSVLNASTDKETDIKTCKTTIWQIGVPDGKLPGADSPSKGNIITYTVNETGPDQANFPMVINPSTTQKLILRYTLPTDVSLKHKVVYFTIGLLDVKQDTKIGVQYVDIQNNEPSKIKNITFNPNQRVIGWALPMQAASRANNSEIHVIFDQSIQSPVKFDFLRLDTTPQDEKVRNVFLVRQRGFSIKGERYQNPVNPPVPKGMSVSVDAGKETANFKKIIIANKRRLRAQGPIWNILTITDEGKLYPLHENKGSLDLKQDAVGQTFTDVTGVVFGTPDNPVERVKIIRGRSEIQIHFADSTYVRVIYRAENGRTRLIVTESTLKDNAIEFISTHLTDNMAAVNQVVIDGVSTKPILDNLSNVTGQQFVFVKTSQNPMFDASTNFELNFPKNVIPT